MLIGVNAPKLLSLKKICWPHSPSPEAGLAGKARVEAKASHSASVEKLIALLGRPCISLA